MRPIVIRLAAAWFLFWAAGTPGAAEPGETAAARDFLVQNVCLDRAGAVLAGVSPVDGNPRCLGQRDLRPGERLPYHKHDHPAVNQRDAAPEGYQRRDSYPVETAGFGVVLEQSFDFGFGDGRRFGVFDSGADGGDIVVLSPGRVSIGATEDGGGGFQLFVGECEGPVTAAALTHAWIVAEFDRDGAGPLQGETVARLNDLPRGRQDICPSRFNPAFTKWSVHPVTYRTGPAQGVPVTLTTLVSEHYGGARPETADHVERFYFTRELGSTRWERWQNRNGNRRLGADAIASGAAALAASGRCGPAEPPAGGAPLVLIDCREWTRIVPPAEGAGDRPGFFIEALRSRGDAPAFFAAPGAAR